MQYELSFKMKTYIVAEGCQAQEPNPNLNKVACLAANMQGWNLGIEVVPTC